VNLQQIKHFETVLQNARVEMENGLRRREDIHIEREADLFDELQNATHRDLVVAELNRRNGQLREIEAAVVRIEEGTYGQCDDCEADIPVKRLNAIPWAAYCVKCQDRRDQETDRFEYDTSSSRAA
jgi:DnaK suppressor protein